MEQATSKVQQLIDENKVGMYRRLNMLITVSWSF